jgi:hypothetical protein
MQRSLHSTAVGAAALWLAACAAPGDAFDPGATISSDRAATPPAHAVRVMGGGTTTFGADLDADGDIDGSHFGFAAVIAGDGSAQGSFTCLMAGNANFLGLRLMAVQGPVTSGASDGHSFSGTATVKVLNAFGPGVQSIFRDIPFVVAVTPGGPGVATLQLTVFGVFDGVPGDVAPANGNYDLAKETLTTGQITIH